jgi:hypothetical protein
MEYMPPGHSMHTSAFCVVTNLPTSHGRHCPLDVSRWLPGWQRAVGNDVGLAVGTAVGHGVGRFVGAALGCGASVGDGVGLFVGCGVGCLVGKAVVGVCVGDGEGSRVSPKLVGDGVGMKEQCVCPIISCVHFDHGQVLHFLWAIEGVYLPLGHR